MYVIVVAGLVGERSGGCIRAAREQVGYHTVQDAELVDQYPLRAQHVDLERGEFVELFGPDPTGRGDVLGQ